MFYVDGKNLFGNSKYLKKSLEKNKHYKPLDQYCSVAKFDDFPGCFFIIKGYDYAIEKHLKGESINCELDEKYQSTEQLNEGFEWMLSNNCCVNFITG
jgi:hypothetical protein